MELGPLWSPTLSYLYSPPCPHMEGVQMQLTYLQRYRQTENMKTEVPLTSTRNAKPD